jgi:hypothetical protein
VLPDADLVAIDPMLLAFERRLSRRGRRSAPDRTSFDRD